MILINIDVGESSIVLIFDQIMIITKITKRINNPKSLKKLRTGSGHIPHLWSPVLWYLVPSTLTHESQRFDEYPVWHL